MSRPIILIPHLFRLAGVIKFRKDYSPPPLVRHLDPTVEVSGPKRPHSRVEEETDVRVLLVVDISYVYWIFLHAHRKFQSKTSLGSISSVVFIIS